jgi:hypothetical protein
MQQARLSLPHMHLINKETAFSNNSYNHHLHTSQGTFLTHSHAFTYASRLANGETS